MGRILTILLILPLFLFFLPFLTDASNVGLEKSLQNNLEKSRGIIKKAQERLKAGYPVTAEINELKALYEEIKPSYLLLQDRFRLREEEVKVHGAKALERHRVMSDNYSRALQQYLSLMDGLSPGTRVSLTTLDSLKGLLDPALSKKKRPIFGSLPYKNLKYPWREPNGSPPIKPAYKGGNKTATPDDLKSTLEAPISMEIGTLAQSLTWNPVLIYEWVKNNIETEWYWGCMKGAEETLRQRRGNDCDQATLLIALLRASGYPARYVRGVIEFYPDIERAKNLTGIDDPSKIPEYFQKAGIPYKTIIAGGRVSNVQIEHMWVETQVPYANYRGAILDEHGKTWLGLDTSIKVTGYNYNNPIDILQEISLANLRDEYLAAVQDLTPLEYIRTYINSQLATRNPNLTYNDLLKTKALNPEIMNILPASMQYRQVKVTDEYTEVPDELKHKVRVIATRNQQPAAGNEILNVTLDTLRVSNQRIAISYEPETIEDQEIINSYGGLDNTPAYLIRLRPVLKINGERIAVGKDGLPMGEEFDLTIELQGAGYGLEKITNTQITGNLSVIGIVSQKAVAGSGLRVATDEEKDAEQLLYEEAIKYIDRWNQAEEELASLMKVTVTRPIPTVVTLGGVIDVTYLLDTPHGFEWKGVYVDSDLRTIEAVASGFTPDERQKTFTQLSSLQGSILENRIFEDDFQVESISTAKLFGLTRNAQPVTEILTIDKTNISTILPTLSFDEDIKEDIQNAVNQNFVIRIPNSEIAYEDWTGIGYIKENTNTGESGYMLSGMIAGGMTAWGIDKWPEYYADILENPYSEPANQDPASARYIQKIAKTDMQKGRVGEPPLEPLEVLVLDHKKKPVKGVEVTFAIKAGGGKFKENGSVTFKKKTDERGIASVQLILGERTSANPTYWWEAGYTKSELVGENIVEVFLPSGTKITKPFTAYGFPGDPAQIKQTHGDGRWGTILSFSGFVSAVVEDKFGNPRSNLPIVFEALDAYQNPNLPKCDNPNRDSREAYLVKADDPCLQKSPTWGDCGKPEFQRRMVETTSDKGASAEVILGALPGGIYPIRTTYENPLTHEILTANFYHYTFSFGNCSGSEDPSIEFLAEYVYLADNYGINIDAGKVGAKIPLMARIYYFREGEMEREITLSCTDSPLICKKIVGNREYSIDTDFKSSSVTFGGVEGTPQGNGIYTSAYTLALEPGLNTIPIRGTASVGVRRTYAGCPSTCNTVDVDITKDYTTSIQVYGVEIQIDPIPIILVNEDGYTIKDYTISYTIKPPEYKALTAFLLISKDGEPITSVPTELKEKGTATISRGFWFDVNSTYEAEVVLNYGTGVEITSNKRKMAIGGILVRDDNGEDVDEVRFGDGSKAEKRYHVELISKVLTESCGELTGKISVIGKDGEAITVPGKEGEYYLSEYQLVFTQSDGKCRVSLKDSTVEEVKKDKFIMSNLSKDALKDRAFDPNTLAVLYGGIGNKLIIEINDAKGEIPIEPLGIILIGIDGLRQDVLYSPSERQVNEPGANYYVYPEDLSGLCEVMGGKYEFNDLSGNFECKIAGWENRHIKLQNVSTIFPSITYAAWASIFTGEQPSKTGITASEFFARDLCDSATNTVPGMAEVGIPPGMVSLDAGAFQPGRGFCTKLFGEKCYKKDAEFIFSHVIPAEFSLFGLISPSRTLSEKTGKSAPLASLQSKTIFEQIKEGTEEVWKQLREKYSISPNPDIRCDQTEYECRTVAIFNQYARGADWWGTPSASFANIYDFTVSVPNSAKIMDKAPVNEADSFISNYLSKKNLDGKRKRFPAVFSIYFSGLDHYAHAEGMRGYSTFFKSVTDPEIKDFVDALKKQGEFDNKIFIVVADHGMTAMPTDLTFRINEKLLDADGNVYEISRELPAEMSCNLRLDFGDPADPDQINIAKEAELNNNNLHIWELADFLNTVGEVVEQTTGQKLDNRVLAPIEIAQLFKDPETGEPLSNGAAEKREDANIIAAFNGPMAHIYLKGSSWDASPDIDEVKKIAEILRVILQGAKGGESPLTIFPEGIASRLRYKIGRLADSTDGILVREGGGYKAYTVVNSKVELKDIGSYFNDGNKYVEALLRVEKMNNEKRSGDIVLIMKDELDIPAGEGIEAHRFTTGTACKSWHGSLNRSDSYVPFIISYPGGSKNELDPILEKDEVCKDNYGNCKENWKLPDILKGIISVQYE